MLELPLMLILVLTSLELVPGLEDDVDAKPTELNLPGNRFK